MTGLHLDHHDGDGRSDAAAATAAPPSTGGGGGRAMTTTTASAEVGGCGHHHSPPQPQPLLGPRSCVDARPWPGGVAGPQMVPSSSSAKPEGGGGLVGSDEDNDRRGIPLTEWMRNNSGEGGRRRLRRRRRYGSTDAAGEHVDDDDGNDLVVVDDDDNNDDNHDCSSDDTGNIREIRRCARLAWAIADAVARLHESSSEVGLCREGGGGVGVGATADVFFSRGVICPDNIVVFDGGGCGPRRNRGGVLRPDDYEDLGEEFRVEIVFDTNTHTGASSGADSPPGMGDATNITCDLRSLGLVLREVFLAASGGSGHVPRSISTLVSRLLVNSTPSDPATKVATATGHSGHYRSVREVERDMRQMIDLPERFLPPPPPPHPTSPVVSRGDDETAVMMTSAEEEAMRPRFRSDVIYGRDSEASILLEACENIVSPPSSQQPAAARHKSRRPILPGMVLVSGSSGTGKSSLVRWMRDHAVRRMGAQCLFGRFEPQDQRRISIDGGGGGGGPFSAIIDALGRYFEDLLLDPTEMGGDDDAGSSSVDDDAWRSHLLETCGGPEGLSVLIGLIPPLGRVIGTDLVQHVVGADGRGHDGETLEMARRRDRMLSHLLPILVSAIASFRPLVLVLDDMQWADEASLDVIRAVIATDGVKGGGGRRSVLFVGCHREDGDRTDEKPGEQGSVSVLLRDWEGSNGAQPITRIKLDRLSRDAVNHMVSDALGAPRSTTSPLTDVVHSVTGGNPHLVVQYVKSLFGVGALRYSHDSASWVWSVDEIVSSGTRGGGAGDHLSGQGDAGVDDAHRELVVAEAFRSLSDGGRGALELAACLGPHCTEEVLRLIAEDDDEGDHRHPGTMGNRGEDDGDDAVLGDRGRGRAGEYSTIVATLDAAVRHGLMTRTGGGTYRYVDERVRRAVYDPLPEGERGALHARIGWRIYRRSSSDESRLERLILVAAEQLHLGLAYIGRRDRIEASKFFLRAGRRAMSMSLFLPASTYLGAGMDLLDGGHWDDQYELNLELYDAGAEIEYCNGNFDRMSIMIDIILAHARTFEERLGAYSTLVNALGAQDKVREAIETGFIVLEGLGEQFPSEDVAASLHKLEWMKTRDMLDGFTDETLVTMRVMEDAGKIVAMKFLNTILLYTYIVMREYLPLVVFRMVQLTLQHGISKESAIAFAMYGYLSCGSFDDIKRGYQFGQMALVLLDRFGSHDCVPRAYQIIYGFIHHWSAHIRQCLEPLSLGYRTGLVFGDIEYALGNARLFCTCSFLCGRNLNALEDEMNVICQEMVRYKQQRILAVLAITRQTVQNLRDETDDPVCLTGDFMCQSQMLNRAHSKNVPSTACFIYMHCLWLAHLFGDFVLAAEMAEKSRNVDELCSAGMVVPSHAFFDGLTSLALARKTKETKWKIRADEALKKMTDWAAYVPCNFQHKVALLEAEFSFLTGDYDEARMAYDVSIAIAGQNGFIHEQALACEKAAIFHFEFGDRSKSSHYFDQAHSLYLEWGAMAKVNHIRRVSLELLASGAS